MRRYVETCLGGGAVLLGLLGVAKEGQIAEPFMRWAGGKRKLFGEITKRLHRAGCSCSSVQAPFSSCGCFHFDTFVAADVNPDLVAAWKAVRDDVEGVVRWLKLWRK